MWCSGIRNHPIKSREGRRNSKTWQTGRDMERLRRRPQQAAFRLRFCRLAETAGMRSWSLNMGVLRVHIMYCACRLVLFSPNMERYYRLSLGGTGTRESESFHPNLAGHRSHWFNLRILVGRKAEPQSIALQHRPERKRTALVQLSLDDPRQLWHEHFRK